MIALREWNWLLRSKIWLPYVATAHAWEQIGPYSYSKLRSNLLRINTNLRFERLCKANIILNK